MKKKNSTAEFGKERNEFLIRAFRESIAAQSRISINNAFKQAAEVPAPRFWVSEARAAVVLGKMAAGEDPTESMFPEKRDMYREMFARFLELREQYPDTSVNDEAPRSYLSWHRARVIIFSEMSRLKRERRKRWSE